MGIKITFLKGLKYIFQAILGWLIVVPLSYLVPKQKDLVLFIGRDEGKFTDNVKYLYLYLYDADDGTNIYFITHDSNTYELLNNNFLPVLYFPSLKTIYKMLQANTVVVDNWKWILQLKYHLLYNTKKVQLWHGLPLKKIELDNKKEIEKKLPLFLKIRNKLGGRFPEYDLLVSTSSYFTDKAFSSAFISKKIVETGYPRNDCLFSLDGAKSLIGTDTENINIIKERKEQGYKIVAYTPTFRESDSSKLPDEILDLNKLSHFATRNNIVFVLKYHPDPDYHHSSVELENIIFYEPSSDIYPLLPLVDVMITDYSSIYFDYLLLNRPIIFFPFDRELYERDEREFYFDYGEMTPGQKCYDQDELQEELYSFVKNNDHDNYSSEREKILELAYKYKDDKSSGRIAEYLKSI